MKIFSWVANKLITQGQDSKRKPYNSNPPADHAPRGSQREEFSDWPHGLLAIGTFGDKTLTNEVPHDHANNNVEDSHFQETPPQAPNLAACSSHEEDDLTPDLLAGKIHKELNQLLLTQGSSATGPSASAAYSSNEIRSVDEEEGHQIVENGRTKDVCSENTSNSNTMRIGKKSMSFLLKKMFVCRSGFEGPPSPTLRDPLMHSSTETRMEKMLKKILKNKIYPQGTGPNTAASSKHFVRSLTMEKSTTTAGTLYLEDADDDDDDKANTKWVKTDDDYIVLEI